MDIAREKIGEHEEPKEKDNPFILECFLHTTYHARHDEIPWCAAFVGWCLDKAGVGGTKNAAATSYLGWGEPCELAPGCIVIFRWESGNHHVAFCDKIIDIDTVACVGGNQKDAVRVSNYGRKHILRCRMPHGGLGVMDKNDEIKTEEPKNDEIKTKRKAK